MQDHPIIWGKKTADSMKRRQLIVCKSSGRCLPQARSRTQKTFRLRLDVGNGIGSTELSFQINETLKWYWTVVPFPRVWVSVNCSLEIRTHIRPSSSPWPARPSTPLLFHAPATPPAPCTSNPALFRSGDPVPVLRAGDPHPLHAQATPTPPRVGPPPAARNGDPALLGS